MSQIEVCASSPCLNDGTCEDTVDGFICVCEGYTGILCDIGMCLCDHCQRETAGEINVLLPYERIV